LTYYVLVKKNVDQGAYVPTYEIHTTKPAEGKIAALEPGECVDVFKCSLSKDGTYITCDLFNVANIDGNVSETYKETFYLQKR